jgi:hypothetical protein
MDCMAYCWIGWLVRWLRGARLPFKHTGWLTDKGAARALTWLTDALTRPPTVRSALTGSHHCACTDQCPSPLPASLVPAHSCSGDR